MILSGISVFALWYDAARARFIAFVVFYGILAGGYNALLPTTIAEVYGADDPLAPARGNGPFRLTRHGSGAVLRLALPFVSRSEVDLARNGDELVVTVGSYRRLLTLPSGMARHRVAGARVDQGELQVRFEDRTEDDDDPAGHVLTAMWSDPLDDRLGPAVSDGEAHSGTPNEVEPRSLKSQEGSAEHEQKEDECRNGTLDGREHDS